MGTVVVPAFMYFISVGSALEMILDNRHEQLPFWAKPEAIGFSSTSDASEEIHRIVESFDETTLKENVEFVERYLVPVKNEIEDFLRKYPAPPRKATNDITIRTVKVSPPETPNYHPGKVRTKDGLPWITPILHFTITENIQSALSRQKNLSWRAGKAKFVCFCKNITQNAIQKCSVFPPSTNNSCSHQQVSHLQKVRTRVPNSS